MILKQQWLPNSEPKLNKGSRSLPLEGEASNYRKLRRKGVKILPPLAASGKLKTKNGIGAFTLYRELDEYISLEHLLSTWGKSPLLTRLRKRILLDKLGRSVKQLHQAKFVHQALSPDHVFVRFIETEGDKPRVDIRIIDLEQGKNENVFQKIWC